MIDPENVGVTSSKMASVSTAYATTYVWSVVTGILTCIFSIVL